MWSMDYVQVPADEDRAEETEVKKDPEINLTNVKNESENTKKRVHDLVKQISMSTENSGTINTFLFSN